MSRESYVNYFCTTRKKLRWMNWLSSSRLLSVHGSQTSRFATAMPDKTCNYGKWLKECPFKAEDIALKKLSEDSTAQGHACRALRSVCPGPMLGYLGPCCLLGAHRGSKQTTWPYIAILGSGMGSGMWIWDLGACAAAAPPGRWSVVRKRLARLLC
jgi:hypothetical protein